MQKFNRFCDVCEKDINISYKIDLSIEKHEGIKCTYKTDRIIKDLCSECAKEIFTSFLKMKIYF